MRFGKLFLATLVMFFALCHNCVNAAQKPIEVECEVQDGSIITGNIFYPEEKKDPLLTERVMEKLLPKEEQSDFCHRMVLFGREWCTARAPRCGECPLRALCPRGGKME